MRTVPGSAVALSPSRRLTATAQVSEFINKSVQDSWGLTTMTYIIEIIKHAI